MHRTRNLPVKRPMPAPEGILIKEYNTVQFSAALAFHSANLQSIVYFNLES